MDTEETLIAQAKEGKQSAYTKLYNLYKTGISFVIYNIVKNKDVTDDLLSVVFTKAFTKLDKFVDNISFGMWLKTIAVNTSIDYIRHTKQEIMNTYVDDENCFVQLENTDRSPEENFVSKENLEIVQQEIEHLRLKHQIILKGKYLDNLTYQDLADKLQIPISKVKSDLNKARQKLKLRVAQVT